VSLLHAALLVVAVLGVSTLVVVVLAGLYGSALRWRGW
jgi:hypothetical protein